MFLDIFAQKNGSKKCDTGLISKTLGGTDNTAKYPEIA
jgi:hypothetical protein